MEKFLYTLALCSNFGHIQDGYSDKHFNFFTMSTKSYVGRSSFDFRRFCCLKPLRSGSRQRRSQENILHFALQMRRDGNRFTFGWKYLVFNTGIRDKYRENILHKIIPTSMSVLNVFSTVYVCEGDTQPHWVMR